MIKGKHLIAGKWVDGSSTFPNTPTSGDPLFFSEGTTELVDLACQGAEEAFWSFSKTTRAQRATFLRRIADEINARGDEITEIAMSETGLPEARLIGERGRTTGQLCLFADYIEAGDYLEKRHDRALPERTPLPRPDLRLIQRPVGPIAVFGASNFPLAFSTAGGDTASALAAGCPVVVKGHQAHPGTSDLVAQAIHAAIEAEGMHPGVFSLVQGNSRDVGASLVQHALIKAVGFTGSLGAGRALFNLCASRPEPIPFYGELGSVNPMFILDNALENRATELAEGWVASLIMGAGQFCTNPGIVVLKAGQAADTFQKMAAAALDKIAAQTMLTDGIHQAYCSGLGRIAAHTTCIFEGVNTARTAAPSLYQTDAQTWANTPDLSEEVFGPLGLIVVAQDDKEVETIARQLDGQLTCTIHMEDADLERAKYLLPVLERKAGRILVNGFPTGVEVCDSMVHGGPFPASTNFGATSVGTMAIRRFLRPVCYQNFPDGLLEGDLA